MKFYMIWDVQNEKYVGPPQSPFVYTTIHHCRVGCRSLASKWIKTPYTNDEDYFIRDSNGKNRINPKFHRYSTAERAELISKDYVIHAFYADISDVLSVVKEE